MGGHPFGQATQGVSVGWTADVVGEMDGVGDQLPVALRDKLGEAMSVAVGDKPTGALALELVETLELAVALCEGSCGDAEHVMV